ncbi:hypothetical protein Pmani_010620 [Petrolisthes manimaculis]|uniref:MADF domain-containing protein n=1 Tax=Petrolisthes manimaculis TaxID=1843537 RepID=A0AAE1Q1T6_9EUCA|nr:hypothetical protein Pmani_010620 [Petrolisthes manimaculis]
MANLISWPQEAIYSLLEKVRDREVLWNIKHKDYPKKNLRRGLFGEVSRELKEEFPSMEDLTPDAVLLKFAYIRGQFQKQLRKILKMPTGSGGNVTPKWEYFQACSFLMPVYCNLETMPSFQLADDVVYDGSLEDLLEGDGIEALQSSSTSQFATPFRCTSTPQPTESTTTLSTSEPPSDTENLPIPSCSKGPPQGSRKRKLSNADTVRDTLLDTLHTVKSRVQKQDDFVTTSVRGFMQYIPESCTKIKQSFTEQVLKLIHEKTIEIHRETANQ